MNKFISDLIPSPIKTSTNILRQGTRTSARVTGLKKKTFALTRGLKTGIRKNKYDILDEVIPYSGSAAKLAKKAVTQTPFAQTKVGKFLGQDISTPVYRKLGLKNKTRTLSGGLFSSQNSQIDF